MNVEFLEALQDLEREKNISKEILIEAIEAALISAYKKNFGSLQNVRVHIDRASGEFKVYSRKTVVEKTNDSRLEISLEEAKQIDRRYQLEDIIEFEETPRNFGRIAAQTAKQVVVQRIREAERGMIYEEFSNREGDIVTGIVQRMENKNIYVDLGRVEALLAPSEQMQGESYRHGERIKAYIVEVKKTTKGPQVMISRTHPGLLKRLFELEVPEIHDGTVELKAASREAGARSKIAVYSRDENVDPVGACVGPKGMRVQAIVTELRGEKIDIVKWNEDPARFVANALSPAKVISVDIIEEEKVARVIVPDYQLSLAIGKEGQNARLAAKLTGWKIDIKSESQAKTLQILPATYEGQGEYEDYIYDDYDYEQGTEEPQDNYDETYDENYDYEESYEDLEQAEYEDVAEEQYDENDVHSEDYTVEDDQKS
ncbi:transcription termination/antitermination protein NusA [Heliorestis acidaminivorans]|uniref:Transcription termination/antitermination protein NusA n=1 Tax=Heliorestis acidaminivorans TaxID=553427 RepID=A0A6I0EU94_9FIRM|nr:transcription termination factor NusA [Heliorestis acidaminivorans]KAB2954355.1 transcription termination/antitermination protein NusA [Heliorestis acidaminivorans]